MIYLAEIQTLADRKKTNLLRTSLRVTKGLVYRIEICFPAGSAGLMGVAIFDGSYGLWPSTVGGFFVGDGNTISFEDLYLKQAAPFIFDIYTYNLDTANPHNVQVRIGQVSKEVYIARFLPTVSNKLFADMLKQIQQEQVKEAELQRQKLLETPFEWLIGQAGDE